MEEQPRQDWWGPRETPYQKWQKGEGIPLYKGSHVADLYQAEVAPWPRLGQRGAFVNLANQEQDDGWLIEIAPGGQTEPLHHAFEATYYILNGRGATTLWQPGKPKQTVEWEQGSLFSPPLNAHYQHFNLDGQRPARLFAGTQAPKVINLFRNADFVFNDGYVFTDRYDGEEDYFTDPGRSIAVRRWKTNFVPDVRGFKLESWLERGAGGSNMFFSIAGNSMSAHLSEFPPGTYKKAHRHGPGAHIVILTGIGYSLLWSKGERWEKVDWRDGSLLSPMDQQYHQHFNSGPEPARYLAFTYGGAGSTDQRRPGGYGADVSEREGGMQVEYEDEDPGVYDLFTEECTGHGGQVVLPKPNYRRE